MNLTEEFREIRRVSTPWVLVPTPDYRVAITIMAAVRLNGEQGWPCVFWDCARGHAALKDPGVDEDASMEASAMLGAPDETYMAPALCLNRALKLPENTILFMVFPNNQTLEDPGTVQAIANLRDEFKRDRRTLVILGSRDLQVPALIADDVPVLREELPTDERIKQVIINVHENARKPIEEGPELERAVTLCRGLTAFAVEENIARKLRKTGLDLVGLAEMQRQIIEQSTGRALMFERELLTFRDVGGLFSFENYMKGLFEGKRKPKLIVRWDEIDKSVNASSSGAVADNTGTSQDQLKVFLTTMEQYKITGAILTGGPGTGKTLSSICLGNTFGVTTLAGDLGACKASLVGESERKIRATMDVIKAIGGEGVLFLATANRLDTLPPELQRRFRLGTWYFAPPNEEERQAIWKIQLKKFELDVPIKYVPKSEGWVGSDIRNCCEIAWLMDKTLAEASTMISLAGKSAAKDIERLEDLAERSGFLSANYPGPFKRASSGTTKGKRDVRLN